MRIAAVEALQQGLMVERIDLADAAVHVEKDDIASTGRMMGAVRLRRRSSSFSVSPETHGPRALSIEPQIKNSLAPPEQSSGKSR